jgi:propanol-preferring alcohol dehydrogenase
MHAMVLNKPAPIEDSPLVWSETADPVPDPREVRVAVRCCAICRTDLHVIEGDIHPPAFPIIPGHQIVGVVDALGPDCRRITPGTRVGIAWLRHACGVCRFCITGRENLCELSRYTGFHANGGFAQYAVAPEDFVYELPESYDDVSAAPLLCAGIIGYRALERCNLRPGGKLGIFGFGSSAHIVMSIARRRRHDVFVVTRGKGHQALAREMGAAWCGDDAGQLPAKLDAAIIFAPAGAIVPAALASLDRGGTLSLAGIHVSPIPPLDYDKYLYGERDIHPVTANTRVDGRELLAEVAAAGIKPHTVRYPLKDANQALQDMKTGRIEGTGVLSIES